VLAKGVTIYFHNLGGVTYKTGSGLNDWIYCTLYIHTVRDYRQHIAIAIVHIFQFTVTHALGFSVFTSHILATDLSQSHCNFKSHMKSSLHCLIPFLTFLQLPILKTRLDYSRLLFRSCQSHIATDSQSVSKSWC
jgi:hypothetical protein